jgi:hypothetical protein
MAIHATTRRLLGICNPKTRPDVFNRLLKHRSGDQAHSQKALTRKMLSRYKTDCSVNSEVVFGLGIRDESCRQSDMEEPEVMEKINIR